MQMNKPEIKDCIKYVTPSDNKLWVDWSTLSELTGVKSTTLHRIINKLTEVETYRYKNRILYSYNFAINFWKNVSDSSW